MKPFRVPAIAHGGDPQRQARILAQKKRLRLRKKTSAARCAAVGAPGACDVGCDAGPSSTAHPAGAPAEGTAAGVVGRTGTPGIAADASAAVGAIGAAGALAAVGATLLADAFRVSPPFADLGAGSVSRVFKCVARMSALGDRSRAITAAVKVVPKFTLRKGCQFDGSMDKCIRRKIAHAVALAGHPNIVRLLSWTDSLFDLVEKEFGPIDGHESDHPDGWVTFDQNTCPVSPRQVSFQVEEVQEEWTSRWGFDYVCGGQITLEEADLEFAPRRPEPIRDEQDLQILAVLGDATGDPGSTLADDQLPPQAQGRALQGTEDGGAQSGFCRLFIGRLPLQCAEAHIEKAFRELGVTVTAHVVRDHDTRKSKGFGYLYFQPPAGADEALQKAPDGIEVMGRLCRLEKAKIKGTHQHQSGAPYSPEIKRPRPTGNDRRKERASRRSAKFSGSGESKASDSTAPPSSLVQDANSHLPHLEHHEGYLRLCSQVGIGSGAG